MNKSDSANFDVTLSQLFRTMGKPAPDLDVKRIWWEVFLHVELNEFVEACAEYVRHEDRFPVPAAVKRYIPRRVGSQKLVTYDRRDQRTGQVKRAIWLLRDCQRKLEDNRGQAKKEFAAD